MDILEALLRLIYLFVLYGIIFNLFVMFTPLRGNPLIATSLFGAVLILYVSYEQLKDFLSSNEIIFKLKEISDEEEDDVEESSRNNGSRNGGSSNSSTNIYNEHNVSNETSDVSNITRVGHSHEFLRNRTMN